MLQFLVHSNVNVSAPSGKFLMSNTTSFVVHQQLSPSLFQKGAAGLYTTIFLDENVYSNMHKILLSCFLNKLGLFLINSHVFFHHMALAWYREKSIL